MGEPTGAAILVFRLSRVLKSITNHEISGKSIAFAVAAAVAPPRPGCVTENTGRTVELAQLGKPLLDELLSTVLLNHVQYEAVVRGSSEGCWIWTTLSTTMVFSRFRPRLSGSSRWGIVGDVGVGRAVWVAGISVCCRF